MYRLFRDMHYQYFDLKLDGLGNSEFMVNDRMSEASDNEMNGAGST